MPADATSVAKASLFERQLELAALFKLSKFVLFGCFLLCVSFQLSRVAQLDLSLASTLGERASKRERPPIGFACFSPNWNALSLALKIALGWLGEVRCLSEKLAMFVSQSVSQRGEIRFQFNWLLSGRLASSGA